MNALKAHRISQNAEILSVLEDIQAAARKGEMEISFIVESREASEEIKERLLSLGFIVEEEMTAHTMVLSVAWFNPQTATAEIEL